MLLGRRYAYFATSLIHVLDSVLATIKLWLSCVLGYVSH